VEREIVGTEVARHQPLHTLPQLLPYIQSRTGTPEMKRAMGCCVSWREGGGTKRGRVEGVVREG
jgi:hypothetical protein